MLWFLFGQFLFAFRGVHDDGETRHVSKDSFYKRLKLALRMAFSASYFAQYVTGVSAKMAQAQLDEDKKSRLVAKIQRKASMKARR